MLRHFFDHPRYCKGLNGRQAGRKMWEFFDPLSPLNDGSGAKTNIASAPHDWDLDEADVSYDQWSEINEAEEDLPIVDRRFLLLRTGEGANPNPRENGCWNNERQAYDEWEPLTDEELAIRCDCSRSLFGFIEWTDEL